MSLLNELIIIDDKVGVPVYLQIANLFIHHIRHGRFRKGMKLPGSRNWPVCWELTA